MVKSDLLIGVKLEHVLTMGDNSPGIRTPLYKDTNQQQDRQTKLLHGEGMSRLLRKSTCKHQVTTEIYYTFHVRLIKWWTHPFDSTQRTKLSFVAQWVLGKCSSRTEVKISSNILSGSTSMSKSRNMACLYMPWSRANVIASAAYKQFSSLVEKGKMRCENPQRSLGSYN